MNEVDKYIDQFDGVTRERLEKMREIARRLAPDAYEGIMYAIVGYKLSGKPLIYFGGFTHHVGLYATPTGHEAFAADFAKYKPGKGSVQFPNGQPLPVELIERVVKYRVEQVKSGGRKD